MTRTTLVPALCRELEVGDHVLWAGEVCEITELGPWGWSTHPYSGMWRELSLLDQGGTVLPGQRVERRGTVLVVPDVGGTDIEVEDQEPPA